MVSEIIFPGEGLDLPVRLPILELELVVLHWTSHHSTGSQQRLCGAGRR